jgi:hypothetical protein
MVEELARRFEVSAQTIRKDLNELCEQRALTRNHGGAMIASGVENLAYEARRFVAAGEEGDRGRRGSPDPEWLLALHQCRYHDGRGRERAHFARGPARHYQ